MRARALRLSFISLISLSTSSMNLRGRETGQQFRADRNSDINLLDDKVDQLVLQHALGMEIGNEERDIVTLYRLTTQDDKVLCTLHHETSEFVAEDPFDLIGLLDAD